MKVLITMLYERAYNEESKEKERVNEINIYKHSPNKVYIITINDKRMTDEADLIKKKFPNLEFQMVYIKEFDVVGITETLHNIIHKEKNNEISINVTEGRKTMSLAGVFAASLNKGKIEGAFYLRQDTHELMPIPLVDFEISKSQSRIFAELNNGNKKVAKISKKLDVNRSFVYASIKYLKNKGFITKKWDVTDSGKIWLMAN